MPDFSKSEQWKRAAILIAWVDDIWDNESETSRNSRIEVALRLALGEFPWDYRWHEVIRSVRDRSAKSLAKRTAK